MRVTITKTMKEKMFSQEKNKEQKGEEEYEPANNPKIAEEMAYAEKPYKEGTLRGIKKFLSNEKTGERLAEKVGELLHNLGSPELIRDHESSPYGNDIYETKFSVEGDEVVIRFIVTPSRKRKGYIRKIIVMINDERFGNPESLVELSEDQKALQKILKPLIDCKKTEVEDLLIKEHKEMRN